MGSITVGAGLGAFDTFLAGLKTTFSLPTVNGNPITDYLGSSTGSGEALQLSAAQVAFEFPETPNNLYLVIEGVGLSLPSTDLNGPINLADATGTVTSATLYSGGTFSNGVASGVAIATVSFSASAYTFTAGTASFTISGSNLPTTAGVVESITSGDYSGPNVAISEISATDNGQTVTLSLTSSTLTLSVGAYSIAMAGNFPTSLTAAEINALATHATSTFDTLLDTSGIKVTSVTITDTATNTVVETATASPGGVPLSGLNLDPSAAGGIAEAVTKLVELVAGGTLVTSGAVASVTSQGTEISGVFLSSGGFAIVADGGQEIVSSGGVASGAVVLDQGQLNLLSGGSATSAVISSGGKAVISAGGVTSADTVNGGGTIILFATATASGVTVSSGGVVGFGQGIGSGSTVSVGQASSAGAPVLVSATTITSGVTVDSGGEIEYGYAVYSGGTISGVGTYFGVIDIVQGASADDITIGQGGVLTLESGGQDVGTTIKFGGVEQLKAGAAPGALDLHNGAILDLNDLQAAGALVNNTTDQLDIISGGNVIETINLVGDTIDMSTQTLPDGQGGTAVFVSPTPIGADFNRNGESDILIENTAGAVVVGQIGVSGQESYAGITGLGSEWKFHGAGDFMGDNNEDFLIENTAGAVYVGEVSNGQVTFTQIGALGSEWSFEGVLGTQGGRGPSEFIIQNTNGAIYVGQVEETAGLPVQTSYALVGALGSEWSFVGTGDYLGDGKGGFLIENTSGAVYVGEIDNNGLASYTEVAALGSEWKFEESGNFLGDGKSDFLIENTAGAVVVGEVVNGQAQYTLVTGLGSEWHFVGAGDYYGNGIDSFLIENTAGAVYTGTVVSGHAQFSQVTALGAEWSFRG